MGLVIAPSFLSSALHPTLRRFLRIGVLVVLCGWLWGCGVINPAPPRSVVMEALAAKVAQTQVALQRQIGLTAETTTFPQVSGIRITNHRWITLNNQPTVAVDGTYHLKGGGLGWGQQRQNRPFSLYLRRGAEEDQWIVVEPQA